MGGAVRDWVGGGGVIWVEQGGGGHILLVVQEMENFPVHFILTGSLHESTHSTSVVKVQYRSDERMVPLSVIEAQYKCDEQPSKTSQHAKTKLVLGAEAQRQTLAKGSFNFKWKYQSRCSLLLPFFKSSVAPWVM